MGRLRFLYRFFGMIWFLTGIVLLLIAVGYIIAAHLLDSFFLAEFPRLAAAFGPLLRDLAPGFQRACGVAFGVFCLVIGSGLLGLRSWTRTVGVPFHIAMGACLAGLTLMFYLQMTEGNLQFMPELFPPLLAVLGGGSAIILLLLGAQMATPNAMEAFLGALPTPPPVAPVKCPTCGERNLDLERARCPVCDAEISEDRVVRAKLQEVSSRKEYPVLLRRVTRIGREMPGFEIQLDDRTVSGEHAKIEYVEGHFYLHALRDMNGTYVNDFSRKVRDTEIKNNDLIRFGQAEFRFIVEAE